VRLIIKCYELVDVAYECDSTRLNILPSDLEIGGIGTVLIRGENNTWGLVCDDSWDDVVASVFCSCLKYKESVSLTFILYYIVSLVYCGIE